MKRAYRWTDPYHGVTHLEGLKSGYNATATEYSTFANAYILQPGPNRYTQALAEGDFPNIDAAKRYIEKQATALNLFRADESMAIE